MLHSICQQIWKSQQWPQNRKKSVFILILKQGNGKECSNYHTIVLISHARKIMLKILQVRLQQYVNQELPVVQARFRKGRGTRDQIVNIQNQRYYFANKNPSSQSYGFLSSHVWMWDLDYKESWRIDAFELWCWGRLLRFPWTARKSNQSILKEMSPK